MTGWLRQGVLRLLSRSAEARRCAALAVAANAHEERLRESSDAELSAEATRLRRRPTDGDHAFTDEELVVWCAVCRECARRAVGMRPFDVQLLAAVWLLRGVVVEMATGEGKTLSGALAAAGFAAAGRSVHVVTVNDYLARRDAEWMAPLYRRLGVSVGWIAADSTPAQRRECYAAEVTYASVSELGFDVLRDRLCTDPGDLVAPPPDVALVDEADFVLVDEARIPLVLAGSTDQPTPLDRIAEIVGSLRSGEHYRTDTEARNVYLTPAGEQAVETSLGGVDLYAEEWTETLTQVNVALHAHVLLQRDVHYLVRDDRIQLINPARGRIATLQRWPDGLHAAVEAKEGLTATGSGQILDQLTVQGLMSRYPTMCGMTATARPAADQLRGFYRLGITLLPPNTPCQRRDEPDRIYRTTTAKHAAIVTEIAAVHATGRPILVGTLDVAESEHLAALLADAGLPCVVLNAKNDAEEAAIIAHAGQVGAITISTQMAGRGTDIRLGGPAGTDHDAVAALNGLYVIGTGHHPSRRLDDQLRGRAGRQGDPGGSVFFASLDDDQVLRFGSPRHQTATTTDVDGRIHGKTARRAVTHAQRVAEGANLSTHATNWRYTRLIEHQRDIITAHRDRILHTTHATHLLADRSPDAHARFQRTVPARVLDQATRLIVLYHLDRCWAEHLTFLADLREGIHLRALAGQDPLAEFHRTAIPAFDQLLEHAYTQAADTYRRASITKDGLDLEAASLRRPTATWTYTVHDNPFGSTFERIIRGITTKFRRTKRRRHDADK